MKRKELKELAKKIAKCELIIKTSNNSAEKKRAEEEIMKLSSHVESISDITQIDELVQEILEKEKIFDL